MNITELARRLRVTTEELRILLPKLGFDIGKRAIKIDNQAARRIIKEWPEMIRKLKSEETIEQKEQEKAPEPGAKTKQSILLPAKISVRDFAEKLEMPAIKLLQELIKSGILVSVNEQLDFETAAIVAGDLGFEVEKEKKDILSEIEPSVVLEEKDKTNFQPRPPVVVVMGHIDHGKSKLLEAIRKVEMLKHEAGGITQHIGAYQIEKDGRKITFLDTPGHEAFISMRSRGAKIADLAILVVAADDGVQPQTLEAINIIQAVKLPFLVAINKIDKPGADQEKVKRQLAELGLVPEEWGGKVICVPISAKMNQGIEGLLETALLAVDLEKERLMTRFEGPVVGTIIESHRDPGEGLVATILIQAGKLQVNDILAKGNIYYGKVRAMRDFQGKPVAQAYPSQPVKILGFKFLPEIGTVVGTKGDKELIRQKIKESLRAMPALKETEDLERPTLCLILKADVLGSLEALAHELGRLKSKEVELKIVDQGFGNIRETDVLKAKSLEASILGFHVQVDSEAEKASRETGVEIAASKIIYELVEAVKGKMEKLLPAIIKEVAAGSLLVLKVFRKSGKESIIGGRVLRGPVEPNTKTHILRQEKMVGKGEIQEIRKSEERLSSASVGQEIGIKIQSPLEIKENDILEIYREEKERRKTERG